MTSLVEYLVRNKTPNHDFWMRYVPDLCISTSPHPPRRHAIAHLLICFRVVPLVAPHFSQCTSAAVPELRVSIEARVHVREHAGYLYPGRACDRLRDGGVRYQRLHELHQASSLHYRRGAGADVFFVYELFFFFFRCWFLLFFSCVGRDASLFGVN